MSSSSRIATFHGWAANFINRLNPKTNEPLYLLTCNRTYEKGVSSRKINQFCIPPREMNKFLHFLPRKGTVSRLRSPEAKINQSFSCFGQQLNKPKRRKTSTDKHRNDKLVTLNSFFSFLVFFRFHKSTVANSRGL